MQKEEILDYLRSKQHNYYEKFGIKFIGLFGSFARGEESDKSDIDISYEMDSTKKLSLFKYLKIIEELEKDLNKKIDLVRKETLKPSIKKYIFKDLQYV